MDWFSEYHYILGSKSPRRQQLLQMLGIDFEVRTCEIPEKYPSGLSKEAIPLFLAELKAKPLISELEDGDLLITADTIVWLNGEVIGKPKDSNDARQMLSRLSGRSHQVISGVCLSSVKKQVSFFAKSEVTFKKLTLQEIDFYISQSNPLDKAGSYGIQDWIGVIGIVGIKGSFYNVMGLPVQKLYAEIQKF